MDINFNNSKIPDGKIIEKSYRGNGNVRLGASD
jgi:hypothetical protein